MQIKIILTYHHYLINRVRQTNKLTTPSLSKDVEPLEFSYMAGGSAKWSSLFGKTVWQFPINIHLSLKPAIPLLEK